jgi:Holliday junction DNA helicase RuvA
MIGLLRGRIAAQNEGVLVVDVGGVGYEVFTSSFSQRALESSGSGDVTLSVHTHVKEDAIQLYGFASTEERNTFRVLLGVSNIGPRTALALLSGLTVPELAQAVTSRDLARLSAIPGIGKKTAERLAFELKDKLQGVSAVRSPPPPAGARADLLSALQNLGYKPVQAEKALQSLDGRLEGGNFEDLLREALRALSRP